MIRRQNTAKLQTSRSTDIIFTEWWVCFDKCFDSRHFRLVETMAQLVGQEKV
mgnify:CR=1 FL=1